MAIDLAEDDLAHGNEAEQHGERGTMIVRVQSRVVTVRSVVA